jgi:hypothetical protein
MTGRYGAAIMRILQVGALLTLGALGSFIFVMWRRERRQERHPAPGSASA